MAKYPIFFGTYSKGEGKGLFRGEFNEETGELFLKDSIDIESPSYLQLNKNILYGVSEIGSFNNANGGSLFSVSIDDPGKMSLISMEGTNGKHPCHLCVQDKIVFAANYSEGTLSIFETDNSGHIAPSYQSIQHYGRGPNQHRQEKPHLHFATAAPRNAYLAVCDLGLDKVFLYPYSARKGLATNAKIINCPEGSGPRHLTFSADGEYLYVLTELANTVLVYKYDDGNTKFLQEISTLPENFMNRSTAAAIHISSCGNFLGASNRGHDSIVIFQRLPDGRLKLLNHVMTGKEPRDFRFAPNVKWLLSANQGDDSVTVYQISENGFTETSSISIPKPVCILFGL